MNRGRIVNRVLQCVLLLHLMNTKNFLHVSIKTNNLLYEMHTENLKSVKQIVSYVIALCVKLFAQPFRVNSVLDRNFVNIII